MFVLCFSISLVTALMNSPPPLPLEKLWPFQRPAFVNFLKSACNLSRVFRGQSLSFFERADHIDDGQSVFVCFSAPSHSVVWKKKKVYLVNRVVWRGHIEFGTRNVFWRRKINLPKGLPYQPFFAESSETLFCCGGELFDGGDAFPITLRAVVNFRKFLVHSILIYSSNF